MIDLLAWPGNMCFGWAPFDSSFSVDDAISNRKLVPFDIKEYNFWRLLLNDPRRVSRI